VQRNIHSYIYAPNCCAGQSPEREGHSCPPNQDIRASTVSWTLYKLPHDHLLTFHIWAYTQSLLMFALVNMRTFSICTVVHCWPQGLSSCRSRCLHANYVRYTLMTPIELQLEYFLHQTLNYSVAILSLFICCFLCFRNPVPHQPFHFTSRECIMYSSVRWQLRSFVGWELRSSITQRSTAGSTSFFLYIELINKASYVA
jgi:hypothetical protein